MKAIKNKQEFAAIRKTTVASATVIRNNVQAMLVFGFAQYEAHGNISFLTSVRKLAITAKAIPVKSIVDYVERYANIRAVDGGVFKSQNNKDRGVKTLDSKWFDSINKVDGDTAPKSTDILKIVQSALKQIDKKSDAGTLNDNDKQVELAESMLKTLISSMEARGFTVTK